LEPAAAACDRKAAERLLESQPVWSVAVIVNDSGQALEALEKSNLAGTRRLPQVMTVQRDSDAREVLQRALTRPRSMRFDPILVLHELGSLEGLVQMDRLIRENLER
jgi:hypothetical protein